MGWQNEDLVDFLHPGMAREGVREVGCQIFVHNRQTIRHPGQVLDFGQKAEALLSGRRRAVDILEGHRVAIPILHGVARELGRGEHRQ
jgi:hypothetical protein